MESISVIVNSRKLMYVSKEVNGVFGEVTDRSKYNLVINLMRSLLPFCVGSGTYLHYHVLLFPNHEIRLFPTNEIKFMKRSLKESQLTRLDYTKEVSDYLNFLEHKD